MKLMIRSRKMIQLKTDGRDLIADGLTLKQLSKQLHGSCAEVKRNRMTEGEV